MEMMLELNRSLFGGSSDNNYYRANGGRKIHVSSKSDFSILPKKIIEHISRGKLSFPNNGLFQFATYPNIYWASLVRGSMSLFSADDDSIGGRLGSGQLEKLDTNHFFGSVSQEYQIQILPTNLYIPKTDR